MEINWLGSSCFRIRSRDGATILTDTFSLEGGLPRGAQATIVTVSHLDSGVQLPPVGVIGENRTSVVVVDSPGEYEVADVMLTGIRSYRDGVKGEERGKNTIFLMETEGITLCHLGDLGHVPTAAQVEALGRVDVLLVPVCTPGGLTAAKAAELVNLIGPKIAVPMTVGPNGEESVATFLKEMGAAELQPQPRLTLSRTGLPEVTTVTLLESRRQQPA